MLLGEKSETIDSWADLTAHHYLHQQGGKTTYHLGGIKLASKKKLSQEREGEFHCLVFFITTIILGEMFQKVIL